MAARFWRVAVLIVALASTWLVASSAGQLPPEKEPVKPIAVVSLSPGQSREVILCWDDGTGDIPAWYWRQIARE